MLTAVLSITTERCLGDIFGINDYGNFNTGGFNVRNNPNFPNGQFTPFANNAQIPNPNNNFNLG